MPLNGAAAAELAPPSAPASAEDQIGEMLVALAAASVQSFWEVEANGRVAPETRERGGSLIAELYQARQVLGSAAFDAMAHRQGQLRLQRHGVILSEGVVDDLLAIVVRVDAMVRAWAN